MDDGQQPHPTSMPLHSSSTLSTVAVTDAMAEATTTVGGGDNDGASFQQPAWFGGNGASTQQQPTCPPTPYKRWENWNYCHTPPVVTLMTPT